MLFRVFIICFMAFFFNPCQASTPEYDEERYGLNAEWPNKSDLNEDHPPFIYTTDLSGTLEASMFAIEVADEHGDGNLGTGFFIKTNRLDNLQCMVTAGHVINDSSHHIKASTIFEYPLQSKLFNYYKYTGNPDSINTDVEFYPYSSDIYVIESYYENFKDIALVLINKSAVSSGKPYSELDYVFLPGSNDEPGEVLNLQSRHHPNHWPMNSTDGTWDQTVANNQIRVGNLKGYVSEGSSGAPIVLSDSKIAIASLTAGTSLTIKAQTLSTLKESILKYCYPGKTEEEHDHATTKTTYKISKAEPSPICETGFEERSGQLDKDLYAHILGLSCREQNSGFINTTASGEFAYNHLVKNTLLNGDTDRVYLYKVRATPEAFSVNKSLYFQYGYTGDANYINTERLVHEQEEWVYLDKIPASQILSAELFLMQNTNGIEHKKTFINKNYKSENSFSDSYYDGFYSGTVIKNLFVSDTINSDLHSACFSQCNLGASSRIQRECFEKHVFPITINTENNTEKTKVYNQFIGEEIYAYTPWTTISRKFNQSQRWNPSLCKIDAGESDDADKLCVSCERNDRFDKANLILSAGGTANTWVDTHFEITGLKQYGNQVCFSSKDIPVVGTEYTLYDYGYLINNVFSGAYSSWWANMSLIPYYPEKM